MLDRIRPLPRFIALASLLLASAPAKATPFEDWLGQFRQQAAAQGISEATIEAALAGLQPIERVVELDRKQPEFLDTFQDYLTKRVNDWRLKKGAGLLEQQAELFREVEAKYGVPVPILAAFWGLESNYGANQGDIPTIAALATLAHDARRPDFFRGQLLDALRILDRGHLAPAELAGSWAGALGHMQFIPATWLAYAVDGDGDGRINLRTSLPDALHSAANYLRQAGWKPGEPWGLEVRLPEGFDPGNAGLDRERPFATWAYLGLRKADGTPLPTLYANASLLLPQGHDGPAFLVGDNFRVILRWNRSIHYALAVGHLADRLAGGPAIAFGNSDNRRMSYAQMATLQKHLTQLGYDAGPADGVPGTRTRGAIRAYQAAAGLPADGYPSVDLLEHIESTVFERALARPGSHAIETAAGKG